MGLVDATGAASVAVIVSPASISFGRAGGDGWRPGRADAPQHLHARFTVYLDARATGDMVLERRAIG
jgi:hypothetical protein